MFDVKKFNDRQGWTIKDLANRLFENGGESRVGMWKSGDSNPRYETILKLIKLGATAEELFGREYAEILLGNSAASPLPPIPPGMDSPEWRQGMLEALTDLQRRGYIRDVVVEGVEKEKDGP